MEETNNNNSSEGKPTENKKRRTTVTKTEVIAKLKDDGDFDNLRHKIIRKLKDNEELRNNIISIVRQSEALNRAGAEAMKPRQLSDAIYDEVGNKVMSQLSDGLWQIIRSKEGMKIEIADTVRSVYDKLVEPERKPENESSSHDEVVMQKEPDNKGAARESTGVMRGSFSGSACSNHQKNNLEWKDLHPSVPFEGSLEEHKDNHSLDLMEKDETDHGVPPGFSAGNESKQPCDGSDEDDPDVPPGFG